MGVSILGESTCILYARGLRTVIIECVTYVIMKKRHVFKSLTITRDTSA